MSRSAVYDAPSGPLDDQVNYIPTAATLPAWRQFRSDRERSLERFKGDSTVRSRSLRTFPAGIEAREKVLDRVAGILHPIRVCPDDVLRLIIEGCYTRTSKTARFYIALRLVAVCSKWRRIGLSTPLLWSYVDCNASNPVNVEFWDFMVESVKSVGISIQIVVVDVFHALLLDQIERFVHVESLNIRLTSLTTSKDDVSPYYMPTLLARPRLESVIITGQQYPRVVVDLVRILQYVPRLRTFHLISNVLFRHPLAMSVPTLVCIKLSGVVDGVHPVALLASCPRLDYFCARHVRFRSESGDSVLVHRALTRLSLFGCTGTDDVLSRLYAPRLVLWKSEFIDPDFLSRHALTLRWVRLVTMYSQGPEIRLWREQFKILATSTSQITSLALPEPFLVLMDGSTFPLLVNLSIRCSSTTDFRTFGVFANGLARGPTSIRDITLVGSRKTRVVWEEIGVKGEEMLTDLAVDSPTWLGSTVVRLMGPVMHDWSRVA